MAKSMREKDLRRGEELERKAEDEQNISTKVLLYRDAATRYRHSKSWEKAGYAMYKSANCYKEINNINKAAEKYMSAGRNYWPTKVPDAIFCFNQAVDHFIESRDTFLAASSCKEVASLCKRRGYYELAIEYYLRSADLFDCGNDLNYRDDSKDEATKVANTIKRKNWQKNFKKIIKRLFAPLGLICTLFVKCLGGEQTEVKRLKA